MGESADADKPVDNEFKRAVAEATPRAASLGHDLGRALKKVASAMEAGAWISSTATTFAHELSGRDTRLGRVGGDVGPDFRHRHAQEPDKVAPDDPRAHWGTGSVPNRPRVPPP